MNLDNTLIKIRPRTIWESIDLGFVLATKWFLKLWGLWLVTGLPVALLLLLLSVKFPLLALLLFCWLKPLHEPLLVYWLSRAVFGEEMTFKTTLKQWRRVALPGLLIRLSLHRFSPERSFLLPVKVLEGLSGEAEKKRKKLLAKNQSGGLTLFIGCLTFEVILTCSALIVCYMLIPGEIRYQLNVHSPFFSFYLFFFSYMLAVSIVTPFYIAAGFILYISRRVELEAWDIEIGFRRMADAFARKKKKRLATVPLSTVLCFVLTGFILVQGDVRAEEVPEPDRCNEIIAQIMEGEEFGQKKKLTHWVRVDKDKKDKEGSWWEKFWHSFYKGLEALFADFKGWRAGFAKIIELVLWFLAGGLAAWLLVKYVRLRGLFNFSDKTNSYSAAPVLFGMEITPESLPDDIAAECRRLFEQGKLRQLLSLLYRGSLSVLVHEHGLEVPESATELECRNLVRAIRPEEESSFFNQLTRVWLETAYGHIRPDVDMAGRLIERWANLYGKL